MKIEVVVLVKAIGLPIQYLGLWRPHVRMYSGQERVVLFQNEPSDGAQRLEKKLNQARRPRKHRVACKLRESRFAKKPSDKVSLPGP